MSKTPKIIGLLIFIMYFSQSAFSQCNTIHFMRVSLGLGSDNSIHIYEGDNFIFTIERGDRIDFEVCGMDEISISASLSQDQLSLFGEKRIDFIDDSEYYVKVGAVPGLDEPTLTLMETSKGERQYSQNNKFNGRISSHEIGKIDNRESVEITESPKETTEPSVLENTENRIQSDSGVAEEMAIRYNDIVSKHGFERYYVMNAKLYDSRRDTPTAEGVKNGFAFVQSNNRLVLISNFESYNHSIQVFNPKGEKITDYFLEGFISPGCKYVITLKDGDIWRSELEILSGSLSGTTRLTELGLFDGRFYHQHWYRNKIAFRPEGGPHTIGTQYIIDTKTKELVNFHKQLNIPYDFIPISGNDEIMRGDYGGKSPDLRYALVNKGASEFGFYDFETNNYIQGIPSSINYYWITNEHIIIQEYDSNSNASISVRNIPEQKTEFIKSTSAWPSSRDELAPGGMYFLYLTQSSIHDRSAYIYCISTKEGKLLEQTGNSILSDLSFSGTLNVHSWISNHELIYVKGGDLIEQGTWYVDATTMNKKRLSGFKAERIVPLTGTEFTYFLANKKTFKFNSITKEVIEIPTDNYFGSKSLEPLDFAPPLYRP